MSKTLKGTSLTLTDQAALPLIADVAYQELFTSSALNRKFCGIVRPGIYRGFNYTLSTGLKLVIGDDSGKNTAYVERDGHTMTIQGQHPVELTLPAGQKSAIVIEGYYEVGVVTRQVNVNATVDSVTMKVVPANAVADHHVLVYEVDIPAGATQITDAMIIDENRIAGGIDIQSHIDVTKDPHKQYALRDRKINTSGPLRGGRDLHGDVNLTIDAATTGRVGAVQLYDSSDSASTTRAATANALKKERQRAQAVENLKYNKAGGTISGNVVVDNGANSVLAVRANDSGKAEIAAYGHTQGTGRLFVGQSSSHGGGIEYNGDSTPETTGAGNDYITLYRRSSGTEYWTARNRHDSNNWEFRGAVMAASIVAASAQFNSHATILGTTPTLSLEDSNGKTYRLISDGNNFSLRYSDNQAFPLEYRDNDKSLYVRGSKAMTQANIGDFSHTFKPIQRFESTVFIGGGESTADRLLKVQGFNSAQVGMWATEDSDKHGAFFGYHGVANRARIAVKDADVVTEIWSARRDTGIGNWLTQQNFKAGAEFDGGVTFANGATSNRDITLTGSAKFVSDPGDSHNKFNLWGGSNSYAIGMHNGMRYGWLNDYAVTFTMSNDPDRGWLWRAETQTSAEGAMSLTTDGRLMVGKAIGFAGDTGKYITSSSSGRTFMFKTAHGQVSIGADNASWAHFTTDRPGYYFDQMVHVNGGLIGSYGSTNLRLHRGGSVKMTMDSTKTTSHQDFHFAGQAKFDTQEGQKAVLITRHGSASERISIYRTDSEAIFEISEDAAESDTNLGSFVFKGRQETDVPTAVSFLSFNQHHFKYLGQNVFHDGYHPNADKLTTARLINLTGDVSGSVSFDGSRNVSITATVKDDSHVHNNYYHKAGGTISGNVLIDNGTTSVLTVKANDNGNAEIAAYGNDQGTGRLFVGQNPSYGGGIEYNGDSTPGTSGGARDNLTLYRRSAGVNSWTATNPHNSNNWYFRGNLYAEDGHRVFNDNYHPNADKWTTARTITLGGDLTGSVSIDGSKSVTLSAQVKQDSHDHHLLKPVDDRDVKPNVVGFDSVRAYFTSRSGLNGDRDSNYQDLLVLNTYRDASGGNINALAFDKSDRKIRHYLADHADTAWGTPEVIAYESSNVASATKLQTARTISLGGDLIGSASFNGTSNITITATVKDDSHAHIISNIDGLQTALNSAESNAKAYTDSKVSELLGGAPADALDTLKELGDALLDNDSDIAAINTTLAKKLDKTGKAADSNKLDGLDSSQFLRRDINSTMNGNLTVAGKLTAGSAGFKVGEGLEIISDDNYFPGSDYYDARIFRMLDNNNSGGNVDGGLVIEGYTPSDKIRKEVLTLRTNGEFNYLGQKVFHAGYHPNADKLTTARTISLGGDLTGSMAFDGSKNVSITAAIKDNSHAHTISNITGLQAALDSKLSRAGGTMSGSINLANHEIVWSENTDGAAIGFKNDSDSDSDSYMYFRTRDNGNEYFKWYHTTSTGDREWMSLKSDGLRIKGHKAFHEGYHPNADKLTTARTISLTGGVTGSVDFDGSKNVSITVDADALKKNTHTCTPQKGNLPVGWYTIAINTGDRAMARFGLKDTNSGDHQSLVFYAAHHYGTDSSNVITVLQHSKFSGSPFRYIRIKDSDTYDGAALQVYIDDAGNNVRAYLLGDNFQSSGWKIVDFLPDADTPPYVDNWASFTEQYRVDIDLIGQGGFSAKRILEGNNRVFSEAYHPNADKLTDARTITLGNDASGSVSFDGSKNVTLDVDVNRVGGISKSRLIYGSNQFGVSRTTDFNSNRKSGFIEMSNSESTNKPGKSTSWVWGWQTSHASNSTVHNYGAQFVVSQDGNAYFRVQDSAGNGTWRTVLRKDVADSTYQKKTSKLTSFLGSLWDTNGGQDLECRGKRALVGTTGSLVVNYSNDFDDVVVQSDLEVSGDLSATTIALGHKPKYSNSIGCSNWFRSSGETGWYNDTYGGGISMRDSTWVRVHGGKRFYVENTQNDAILSNGGIKANKGFYWGTQSLDDRYLKRNADNALTGNTSWVSGKAPYIKDSDLGGRIPAPGGAAYNTGNSTVTGAIKIALPVHGTADMLGFEVSIYDYNTNESVKLLINGYLYQATGSNEWHHTTVTVLTPNTGKDYTVRFGADGSRNCVWIGETNSTWSYPQVAVSNFFCGFSSNVASYASGWKISFESAFDTIDETSTGNLPAANKAKDADKLGGRGRTGYIEAVDENGYPGLARSGNDENWIRTPKNGLIPWQSGGTSSLGTSSWPFSNVYAKNIYDDGELLENRYVRTKASSKVSGLITIDRVGEALGIGDSSLDGNDAYIRMGNGTYDWHIKYVGSTSGNPGNELRFESSKTGKYWQFDHDGNFEYWNGSAKHKVWHAANDGSGSGLDADKLDGLHASSLMRSNAADDFTHTAAIGMPKGTTAQRGTAKAGKLRFNTDLAKFEGHDGTKWGAIGGGGLDWKAFSTNTTAATGTGYLLTDAAATLTLPASPNNGDIIGIGIAADVTETRTLTLAHNGKKLMGLDEDFVLKSASPTILIFSFVDANLGWSIVGSFGESNAIGGLPKAEEVSYDNAASNLEATTTQGAIDEADARLEAIEGILGKFKSYKFQADNADDGDFKTKIVLGDSSVNITTIELLATTTPTTLSFNGMIRAESVNAIIPNDVPTELKWQVPVEILSALGLTGWKDSIPGVATYEPLDSSRDYGVYGMEATGDAVAGTIILRSRQQDVRASSKSLDSHTFSGEVMMRFSVTFYNPVFI